MKSEKPLRILALVIGLATVIGVLAVSHATPPVSVEKTPETSALNVLFVGDQGGLAGSVSAFLESRTGAISVTVTSGSELGPLAARVESSWIVVFDSAWFQSRVGDPSLESFLRTVLPTGVGLTAIGASTSLLFDALTQVRDDIFAEDRNPASDNPPLAGYKLKLAARPDGTVYYYDSILVGYSTDIPTIADSILNWR